MRPDGSRRCLACQARRMGGYQRKFLYRLTEDEYQRKFAEQGGLCDMCRQEALSCVDHDHESSRVRGLLCRRCNLYLGYIETTPSIVKMANDYLHRWGSR